MIYVNWPSGAGGDFLISLGMIAHKISGIVCSPRNQFGESAKIGSESVRLLGQMNTANLLVQIQTFTNFLNIEKTYCILLDTKKFQPQFSVTAKVLLLQLTI